MLNNKKPVSKHSAFDSQSGKSLIEVVVVLIIVVIVATFAVAQYRSSKTQFVRQNIARQLKNSLERARFDSVKRRTLDSALKAKVFVSQSGFSLITDANGNGTIETSDTEVTSLTNLDVNITGQSMAFPVEITFDNRGNMEAKGSDNVAVNPVFYVCNGTCTPGTATSANSNVVLISQAGTVNLLNGGASLPSFSNPSVTTVAGGESVNCLVAISSAGCATVSPTPTPTPTPTLTPTPTPTVSPTATPAPVLCAANEKPALTKCQCQHPMTIKTNGKCS